MALTRKREYSRNYRIYCLLRGEQIVYIGLSMNLPKRIETHKQHGKEFDSHSSFPVNDRDSFTLESFLIRQFQPEYNKIKTIDPAKKRFAKRIGLRREDWRAIEDQADIEDRSINNMVERAANYYVKQCTCREKSAS